MKVRLLLFAQYRAKAGASEISLEMPQGSRAIDAVNSLRLQSAFDHIPERPVVAVNQEYSDLNHILSDGDELALLPPVAGG
jgi:MoaE-MoaD fusion protein